MERRDGRSWAAWTAAMGIKTIESAKPPTPGESLGMVEIRAAMNEMLTRRPIKDMTLSSIIIHDGNLHETALHEGNHALMAPGSVAEISVVPEGRALGVTRFTRSVTDAEAAAGMVDTPRGRAKGTGGDYSTIAIRAWLEGRSISAAVNAARGEAQARLSAIDDDFKVLVANGVAARKRVSGSEFRLLMDQADWEMEWRDRFGAYPGESMPPRLVVGPEPQQTEEDDTFELEIPEGEHLFVIDVKGGSQRFVHTKDGVIVENVTVLPCCGSTTGQHDPHCAMLKPREPIPGYPEESESATEPLTRNGTVYTGNNSIQVTNTEEKLTVTDGMRPFIQSSLKPGRDTQSTPAGQSTSSTAPHSPYPERQP